LATSKLLDGDDSTSSSPEKLKYLMCLSFPLRRIQHLDLNDFNFKGSKLLPKKLANQQILR
jgi:hypothetical protein